MYWRIKLHEKLPARRDARGNWWFFPFCIEFSLISVICYTRTSESEQYTQYTRVKRNAYYELFNTFLRQNQVHLDWKDVLLVVEVPPWVYPLCLVPEKKQFGIWVFLEVQEINFVGPLKVNMIIVCFYIDFFSFNEKVPSTLDHTRLFRNILPHHISTNSNDIFYWFLLADNRTMQIKLTAALLKKPGNKEMQRKT